MKSRAERRQREGVSAAFIPTQRAKHAFTRIDELVEHGWEDKFCRSLLLLGHSRVGKTHVVENYIRLRSTSEIAETEHLRVLKVEVQSGCTLKIFATDLLIALRDPNPEFGSQAEKTRRIAEAIKAEELDLLVFDELQRLIDGDTDKVKRDVANWITGLLNRRLCPLLLVGERSAERVFESTMHAKGRTFGQVEMKPHDWADEADRKEFRAILHLLDGKIGMAQPSGLGETAKAIRIYAYAQGLLGQAATLIAKASLVAGRIGRPSLTEDILAQAVDELRIGEDRKLPNPFRTDVENPTPSGAEVVAHVPRRAKAGKPRPVQHED